MTTSGEEKLELLDRALAKLATHSLVDFQEALETLLVYIKNVVMHPTLKKYRKVKVSNVHYQERLGHLDGATEAMAAVGYLAAGEYLVLATSSSSLAASQTADAGDGDAAAAAAAAKEALEQQTSQLRALEKVITARLRDVAVTFEQLPHRLTVAHRYTSVAAAGTHSAIGKRHSMEDDEIAVDAFNDDPLCGFFGVYDGHGGRATVNLVVKVLHMNLARILTQRQQQLQQQQQQQTTDTAAAASSSSSSDSSTTTSTTAAIDPNVMGPAFTQAYLACDAQVRRQNILQSGTTSVTVVVRTDPVTQQRWLHSANVGDSRAILVCDGVATRLTIDHKASLPEEAARIEAAGGFVGRNKRVNGVLAISRALGDHMLKENAVVSATPHCVDTPLTRAHTHCILACDGLWDVMTDQEAVDFALERIKEYTAELEAQTSKTDPVTGVAYTSARSGVGLNIVMERVAKSLVDAALERRSMDNVTTMVVALWDDDDADASASASSGEDAATEVADDTSSV